MAKERKLDLSMRTRHWLVRTKSPDLRLWVTSDIGKIDCLESKA